MLEHRTGRRAGFGKIFLALIAASSVGVGIADIHRLPENTPTVRGCPSPAPKLKATSPSTVVADFVVTVNGNLQYLVNGQVNPTLTLNRGQTYLFDLTAFGDEHPFVINLQANNPFGPLLAGPSSGEILSFTPDALPSTVYYHCEVHYGSMTGTINIVSPQCNCGP